MPITRGINPSAAISELSIEPELVWILSVDEMNQSAPKPIELIPPIRRTIPPIIIKIAIIVTPVGLFVFVVKLKPKLLINTIIY